MTAVPPRPCEYAPLNEEEQASIRRLFADKAYQPAIDWLLYRACGLRDLSYRPDSARDTDFAEGKRFVGLQFVRAAMLPMKDATQEEPHGRRRRGPGRK